MEQVKSTRKSTWLKNTLWIIGIAIFVVLLASFLGYIAVTFFPGINIQHWFQQTKLIWIAVRLVIYGVVGGLVFGIHQYQPITPKLVWLLVLGISLFEILNIFYMIG